MSKLSLLTFVIGIGVILYGIYFLAMGGDNAGFIFVMGGVVITALGAGLFSKAHSKGSDDASR